MAPHGSSWLSIHAMLRVSSPRLTFYRFRGELVQVHSHRVDLLKSMLLKHLDDTRRITEMGPHSRTFRSSKRHSFRYQCCTDSGVLRLWIDVDPGTIQCRP